MKKAIKFFLTRKITTCIAIVAILTILPTGLVGGPQSARKEELKETAIVQNL